MTKFQLEGLAAAEPGRAELVAETDAEDGDAAGELADIFDGVGGGLGIAGAVGEEDTLGFHGEDVFGGGARRDYCDVAVVIDEAGGGMFCLMP